MFLDASERKSVCFLSSGRKRKQRIMEPTVTATQPPAPPYTTGSVVGSGTPSPANRVVPLKQKNCLVAACLWCPPVCIICGGSTHRCYIEDWTHNCQPNWVRLLTLNYCLVGWLLDICSLSKQVKARNETLRGDHTRTQLNSIPQNSGISTVR